MFKAIKLVRKEPERKHVIINAETKERSETELQTQGKKKKNCLFPITNHLKY